MIEKPKIRYVKPDPLKLPMKERGIRRYKPWVKVTSTARRNP